MVADFMGLESAAIDVILDRVVADERAKLAVIGR